MPEDVFTEAGEPFATSKMVRDWLRKPFPPQQVGRIPASKGRPALDFVGHAAVTDRLNKIAPDWTYTVDNLAEVNGQFWIRGTMTIGGVSRPEFGDGDNPKEAIGNFIRRAAMRFGVAIDLWSREELESAPVPSQAGVDAGGRIENTSSASRESSGSGATQGGGDASPSSRDRSPSSSEGIAERQGEGRSEPSASSEPGEVVLSPSPGKDAPGPPHYSLEPKDCSHKRTTGTYGLLSPRKSPRGPVCPRCGLSYIAVKESTTVDLGAAS